MFYLNKRSNLLYKILFLCLLLQFLWERTLPFAPLSYEESAVFIPSILEFMDAIISPSFLSHSSALLA